MVTLSCGWGHVVGGCGAGSGRCRGAPGPAGEDCDFYISGAVTGRRHLVCERRYRKTNIETILVSSFSYSASIKLGIDHRQVTLPLSLLISMTIKTKNDFDTR